VQLRPAQARTGWGLRDHVARASDCKHSGPAMLCDEPGCCWQGSAGPGAPGCAWQRAGTTPATFVHACMLPIPRCPAARPGASPARLPQHPHHQCWRWRRAWAWQPRRGCSATATRMPLRARSAAAPRSGASPARPCPRAWMPSPTLTASTATASANWYRRWGPGGPAGWQAAGVACARAAAAPAARHGLIPPQPAPREGYGGASTPASSPCRHPCPRHAPRPAGDPGGSDAGGGAHGQAVSGGL
jgi:hypothetical protein